MKKIKSLLMLLIAFFLFPFMVYAENANVTIEDVTRDSKTQGVEVTTEPQITGLNINFGLEFSEVGDKVVYKAVFNNQDNEDYSLTLPSGKEGEYVTYSYAFEDGNNVLKAKSKKTLVITIEYKKEVPDSALENGKYVEANQVKVTLADSEGKPVGNNPKTGQSLLLIGLLALVIVGSSYVVYKNNKSTKSLALLVAFGLLIVPMTIYALKELNITVNTSVSVAKWKEFCVINYQSDVAENPYRYYSYKTGTTFSNYLRRAVPVDSALPGDYVIPRPSSGEDLLTPDAEYATEAGDTCGINVVNYVEKSHLGDATLNGTFQNGNSIILDADQGCYFLKYTHCIENDDQNPTG